MLKKPGANSRSVLLRRQIKCAGKENTKRQSWITEKILDKKKKEESGKDMKKEMSLSKTIRKNDIYNEIESLDKPHNPKMYQKVTGLGLGS